MRLSAGSTMESYMKKVAVLINTVAQQYEGLRTSLGLLLEDHEVQMYVLNHEIADMDEAYADNLSFIEEMEGEYYSSNSANAEKYGFTYLSNEDIAARLTEADLIIPF